MLTHCKLPATLKPNKSCLSRAATAGLETDVLPAGDEAFADLKPSEAVDSQTLAAALYDIYLGADGPLRGARDKWAAAARAMLADDANSKESKGTE